jgi:hypothetical protein
MILAFQLEDSERITTLSQDGFPPGDQLTPEILALALAHERFGVRRLVAFRGDIVHE